MKELKKLLKKNKSVIVGVVFLILAYFFLRVVFLTKLEMLNDESIYLHWAQMINESRSNLSIPIQDGRQPLFIWAVSLFTPFITDQLFAGRLVSVLSGIFTLFGVMAITHELFQRRETTFFSGLLYIVYPFSVMYDRLALLDSMVGAFTVWSIYLSILLARRLQLAIAYTVGFVIGGSLLTKSNGIFNLYLLPLSLLLFHYAKKNIRRRILKFSLLVLVVIFVAMIIQMTIVVLPNYNRILDVNQIFIIPKRELIMMPFGAIVMNFLSNSGILFFYFIQYFAFPFSLLFVLGLIGRKFVRENLYLLLYFLLPLFALALFGRFLLPRYIYFMTLSLLPICALGLTRLLTLLIPFISKFVRIPETRLSKSIVALILLYPVIVSGLILYDLQGAPVPLVEKVNYISVENTFTKESMAFLLKESKEKKIFLAADGRLGWIPNLYQVRLYGNKNILIKGYEPIREVFPDEILHMSSQLPTYFVTNTPVEKRFSENVSFQPVISHDIILHDGKKDAVITLRLYKVNHKRFIVKRSIED